MSLLLQDILHVELEPGTVLLYTKRVVIASMSLWKEVVSWISKREEREMRNRINKRERI